VFVKEIVDFIGVLGHFWCG